MSEIAAEGLTALLELAGVAALLLDGAGRVVFSTRAASALLRSSAMLTVKDGMLAMRRAPEDRALRDVLQGARDSASPAALCLRSRDGTPMLAIDVRLLPSGGTALVFTALSERHPGPAARYRDLFGLTPAEARVAAALAAGQGIAAIARSTGVEAETIRSQVKRIRAKTGTDGVPDLVRLLAACRR